VRKVSQSVAGASTGRIPLPLWMSGIQLYASDIPNLADGMLVNSHGSGQTCPHVKEVAMRADVAAWFTSATSIAAEWRVADLREATGASTVSVVLPALNEAETVGTIVTQIASELMLPTMDLVDELVVIDSGSTDDTARCAEDAGAKVLHRDDILPSIEPVTGKGEAMWRGLAATHGDVVVFIDADLRSFASHYVTALLGPLLTNPAVDLVKAVYERPLIEGDSVTQAGGGRVTELMARPLLNLYWPELAGVIQPLAGEYAARRSLLEQLPFPCGYGVELALLVDTLELRGLNAIAQVDLGVRLHRHHDERKLGRMAAQILRAALVRQGYPTDHTLGTTLDQFERGPDGFSTRTHTIDSLERPPLVSIAEYAEARAASATTDA